MKKMKRAKTSIQLLALTVFVIVNIIIGNYIRLNISDEYIGAFWLSVGAYGIGVYFAIALYYIND